MAKKNDLDMSARIRLKHDMYRRISKNCLSNVSEETVKNVLDAFFNDCYDQVKVYGEFDIVGFGKWYLKEERGRDMHIPQPDGTFIKKFVEYYKVKFTPSQKFKDIVNDRVPLEPKKKKKKKKPKRKTDEEKATKNYSKDELTIKQEREAFLKQLRVRSKK